MKRIYIKPATELVEIETTPMLEGSDPNTNWTVGDDPIGGGEPDPEGEEAKQSLGLWEEGPQSPNIWGDGE